MKWELLRWLLLLHSFAESVSVCIQMCGFLLSISNHSVYEPVYNCGGFGCLFSCADC